MSADGLRRIVRRLKRSTTIGSFLIRTEERIKDGVLRVNVPARRGLTREWQACASDQEKLAFSVKYLSPGQRAGEIMAFAEFLRAASPRVFCEIGTLRGGTHLFLTHAVPSVAVTVAIDRILQNKGLLRLLGKGGQRACFIEGPSQSPKTLAQVSAALGGEPIDLLFIDGDHEYESVRSDFLTYRTLVRDGGVIAFHDVCDDYQTRFGRATGHFAGGVPRLWAQLRACHAHYEFVDSPDQDGFGIGVMVHSAAVAPPATL